MSNDPRTIIIGDIHGCFLELMALLKKISLTPLDRLVTVGDLVGKGPDSRGVLEWALRTVNLTTILGNHEHRLLEYWKKGSFLEEKSYDSQTLQQLGDDFDTYMRVIDKWPLIIEEKDYLIVHAGFDPRRPLKSQTPMELTNIRRVTKKQTPWYELYTDPKLIVFGHWAQREPIVRKNVVGLDTGCVYGGALSALILPERRIISVPAQRIYRKKVL